jgi:hypothetical protein
LFGIPSRRVLDTQLFLNTGIDAVIGFSLEFWISQMLFHSRISGNGFVLKTRYGFYMVAPVLHDWIWFLQDVVWFLRKVKDSGLFRISGLGYSKDRTE